jgi:hypothetical protein
MERLCFFINLFEPYGIAAIDHKLWSAVGVVQTIDACVCGHVRFSVECVKYLCTAALSVVRREASRQHGVKNQYGRPSYSSRAFP